jgi:lysozyme family protein
MAAPKYESYSKELLQKYNECKISNSKLPEIQRACRIYQKNRSRYKFVEKATGVPAQLVFCIHQKESDCDFSTCLHNGDPLPGPTVHVPKGRGPFKSWEEAAIDALKVDKLADNASWSIERMLYLSESYNGWGYQTGAGVNTTPPRTSPYLWTYTDQYEKGLYTSDGYFSPYAVSKNPGVASLLKVLTQMDEMTEFTNPQVITPLPFLQRVILWIFSWFQRLPK